MEMWQEDESDGVCVFVTFSVFKPILLNLNSASNKMLYATISKWCELVKNV